MSRRFAKAARAWCIALPVLALAAIACSGDNAPPVPSVLTQTNATISGIVGKATTVVPAVTLRDANGLGIANAWVHFAVKSGSGTVGSDSSRTDRSGVATAGSWTLGTVAGNQTVAATATGVPPLILTALAQPDAAKRFERVSIDGQQSPVNALVTSVPSVRVVDQYGNGVAGIPVVFEVILGGGVVTGAQKTSQTDGIASLDSWKLGTISGLQAVRVSALVVPTITFSANALAAAPATMTNASSTSLVALASSLVTLAPSVRVADIYGNAVPNVLVNFVVTAGGGQVSGATIVTNTIGVATIGGWVMGATGAQTLVATVQGFPNLTITFNATISTTAYSLAVRYVGEVPSARQQLAVTRALTKWRSIIVGAVGSAHLTLPAGTCLSWVPMLDEQLTDLLILARIGPIDGVGGARDVLGRSGPCLFYLASGLPAFGVMELDVDNLSQLEANGTIDAVIMHEMGHVIGFGTDPWITKGLLAGNGSADPIFVGSAARDQFNLFPGLSYTGRPVPVENTGTPGDGSYGSHWRESLFGKELMSPALDQTGPYPLSRATVGSLADEGYEVSFANADAFSFLSSVLSPATPLAAPIRFGNDVLVLPTFFVDEKGVISPRGLSRSSSVRR